MAHLAALRGSLARWTYRPPLKRHADARHLQAAMWSWL